MGNKWLEAEKKYFRGWMFLGFSSAFPKGKIKTRKYMNEDCLLFRSESGKLNMIEPYCSHFGTNMATGKVISDDIQCPMHGRMFKGDGACRNAKFKSIRSYPIEENGELVFGWFDEPGVEPQWEHPQFINEEEYPDILWRHGRKLELHHPSVPQNNGVDPRHFEFTHAMFGKVSLEGNFKAEGHKATCKMGAELTQPLATLAKGDTAEITTLYDGPLNDFLISKTGSNLAYLGNFLTVIDGKHCQFTQIGLGKRTLNPLKKFQDLVSAFFSWNATREDEAVWSNRKPQEQDYYPHETDQAIKAFSEWVDTFQYFPDPDRQKTVADDKNKLKVAQI
ncbi:MAG: Rieske 2Fe-2S domain-containing protein [Pseudomonadales bacterium]|nr:Rieske 2Fe-2S domain-containing protein [Pseudomonadales bacterium]